MAGYRINVGHLVAVRCYRLPLSAKQGNYRVDDWGYLAAALDSAGLDLEKAGFPATSRLIGGLIGSKLRS